MKGFKGGQWNDDKTMMQLKAVASAIVYDTFRKTEELP